MKPLRVLILDDSEEGAAFLVRALCEGGFDPVFRRVATIGAMKDALRRGAWDLVLSDYGPRRFSGPDALKLLRNLGLDIPLIVCSRSVGEEGASAAMKAGARDFIGKENLSRLVPAVERELQEAMLRHERKRADDLLRESEEKYRSLVENIPDVTWRADQKGNIIFVSSNIKRIYGYAPEEIYRRNKVLWFKSIHPGDLPRMRRAYRSLFRKKEMFDVEYRVRTKDKSWIWLCDRAVQTFERRGKLYADGVLMDITARKKAEEELKQKTEELEKSHRQLQNLTYVFSQDLLVPLRRILSLSRRLRSLRPSPFNNGGNSGQVYLKRIQGSAYGIRKLIKNLLRYSGIQKKRPR